MKKALLVTLIITAILVLATGCNGGDSEPLDLQAVGGSGQSEQGDTPGNSPTSGPSTGGSPTIARPPNAPDMDLDMDGLRRQVSESADGAVSWPAEILPQGLPVYPGGEILFAGYDDYGDVLVYIEGTDEGVFNAYRTSLGSAGWEFFEEDEGWSGFFKGGVFLYAGFAEGDVAIYVFDLSALLGDVQMSWPTSDLPAGFPVYPGEVEFASAGSYDVFITIKNSDRRTFDGYIETMRADGWQYMGVEADGEVELAKDTMSLMLSYLDNGDVYIGLYTYDYDFAMDSAEWPSVLPFHVPQYTEGTILIVAEHVDGSVDIMIHETSREAIDRYVAKLIEAGGELDDGNTPDSIMVWMGANGEFVSLMIDEDDDDGEIILYIEIDIR